MNEIATEGTNFVRQYITIDWLTASFRDIDCDITEFIVEILIWIIEILFLTRANRAFLSLREYSEI